MSATWSLAGPIVATQLAAIAMGFVDTIMVGPLGTVPLGAVAVGNAVFLILGLGLAGVLMALDAIVGNLNGAKALRETGNALWQGYWLALGLGTLATPLFFDVGWIMRLMGQSDAVADGAAAYLFGRSWSMVPWLLFTAQRSFLSGIGNTRVLIVFAVTGALVNVPANYAFIHGAWGFPALGLMGVGIATTVAQTVMLLLAGWVVHVVYDRQRYGLEPRRPERAMLRRILRLGGPFGFHLAAELGSISAMAVMAGWISEASLGAHQVAFTLCAVTFMVPLGVSMAASVRVSHCLGARDPERARLAGWVALIMGAAFMMVTALIMVLWPRYFLGIFSPPADVMELGVGLLYVGTAFQVSDGIQVVGAAVLRGTGDTRTPALANLVIHWGIGLPLGYVLAIPLGMGVSGLWVGFTAGLTGVAVVCVRKFATLGNQGFSRS